MRNLRNVTFLMVALMLVTFSGQGIAADKQKLLKAADIKVSGNYVRSGFLQQLKKPFNPNDPRKKLLLIGDSHAQDFYNALLENDRTHVYQISTRYIPKVCQMYWGKEDISAFRQKKHAAICAKSDTLAQAQQQVAQADIVILVASWEIWAVERLAESVDNLKLQPKQTFIVVGRKSFGKPNIRKYLRMSDKQLKTLRNPVDDHQVMTNKLMKSILPSHVFVDVQRLLCRSVDTCPIFTNNVELISFDGGHLTPEGAKYMGEVLFKHAPLNRVFGTR